MSNDTKTTPQIGISFPTAALEFVDRGCEALGLSRSRFVRNAAVAAAAEALGEEAPALVMGPGRRSPLGEAAAAAGMTVKDYMRYCALEKHGLLEEESALEEEIEPVAA